MSEGTMSDVIYVGTPAGYGLTVEVQRGDKKYPLPLYLDWCNHSPTGFACGYGGSGPAQLALAILGDFLGRKGSALALYQAFKWEVIAKLPNDRVWRLTGEQIAETLEALRAELAKSRRKDSA